MKTILVPTDFSRGARRAADRAIRLGARSRHVHLVHVRERPLFGAAPPREDIERRLAGEAARLRRQAGELTRVNVTTHLRDGQPYVEIIRLARELEANVIVLGCQGVGERPEKVLGRTAARVARMADIPVLVVRRTANAAYRRPLVALPLDPSARRLVKLAQSAAGSPGVPIAAVRSYTVPFPGLMESGSERKPSAYHTEVRRKAEKEMRTLLDSMKAKGVRVRARLREGDARGVILAEAARTKADLITVGTHGRSGLAHLLIGSVAEWVLANARVDVLVARPVRFTFETP